MTGRWFKRINRSLSFSKPGSTPDTEYKFFEEMPMKKAWNANMLAVYEAGPIITPDELMNRWLHRVTCPGWTICPRKPWD
jgi:hypothetical protein